MHIYSNCIACAFNLTPYGEFLSLWVCVCLCQWKQRKKKKSFTDYSLEFIYVVSYSNENASQLELNFSAHPWSDTELFSPIYTLRAHICVRFVVAVVVVDPRLSRFANACQVALLNNATRWNTRNRNDTTSCSCKTFRWYRQRERERNSSSNKKKVNILQGIQTTMQLKRGGIIKHRFAVMTLFNRNRRNSFFSLQKKKLFSMQLNFWKCSKCDERWMYLKIIATKANNYRYIT